MTFTSDAVYTPMYSFYSFFRFRYSLSMNLNLAVTLLAIMICRMFCKLNPGQCRSEYSIGGMMLKGHTFLEKTTANWLKCVDKCNDDIRCQSFNYVMTRGICELNDRTKDARPEHFVKDSERVYLKRLSKRGNCFPVIKVIVSSIFCEKSIHFLYANLLACLID